MPEAQLVLGVQVTCTDGKCGVLQSLVVDPAGPRVTHIVVEPEHRIGLGRLAPIGLVVSSDEVAELSCDLAAFNALPEAESTEVVQDLSAGYIFLHATVLERPEIHDVLPEGEAGLRSGTEVLATDGAIGAVGGLLTGGDDHQVTSVLVTEGRLLWGHKTVVIPVSAVTSLAEDAVQLNLPIAEVERIAVDFKH
jgi:sporulation protein YlmC with PRC-barrel domain